MHTFSIGYTVLLQAIHFSCVPANINDAFVGALVCCISTGNYEYIKQCSWLPSALLPPILCILTFFLLRLYVTVNCETQLPVKSQVLTTKEKCNFFHVPGSFLIRLQLVTSAKEILYCMTISTGTREIPTSLST
jgi:ATP/ADP translocase